MINKGDLPLFFNHLSARLWLKDKYDELIVMRDVVYRDELKVYMYHLVLKKDVYIKNFKLLEGNKDVNVEEYKQSYQPIEITESGMINIKECIK